MAGSGIPMKTQPFDSFMSFASEDEAFATTLSNELIASGFSIWFAPLNLNIGDRLLDSINAGLTLSRTGLLLLSKDYIRKNWTSYELDVLLRQHIETNKRVLPIWHGVGKAELDGWNPGISGIIGISSDRGIDFLTSKIISRISEGAPFRGVAPSWEDPFHRFLRAQGELKANRSDGPTFNIFEAILLDDSYFPIFMDGKNYQKSDLAYHVAMAIAHKSYDFRMKPSDDQLHQITDICISFGYNPSHLA
jgi:hypothetical protein